MLRATPRALTPVFTFLLVIASGFLPAVLASAQRSQTRLVRPDDAEFAARRAARAMRLVQRGDALARGGNRASALGAYRQAVQIDPRLASAYVGLARLYRQTERVGDANEALRVGLRHRPESSVLNVALADLEFAEGEGRSALRRLVDVMGREPRYAPALRLYVQVSRALSAWPQALQGVRRLRQLAQQGLLDPVLSPDGDAEPDLALLERALQILVGPLDGACSASGSAVAQALCR